MANTTRVMETMPILMEELIRAQKKNEQLERNLEIVKGDLAWHRQQAREYMDREQELDQQCKALKAELATLKHEVIMLRIRVRKRARRSTPPRAPTESESGSEGEGESDSSATVDKNEILHPAESSYPSAAPSYPAATI